MAPFDPSELLRDLGALAGSTDDVAALGLSGASARDITLSIENSCKNALDDEIAGAVSLLFERKGGLPALLLKSLENSARNEKPLRELRTHVLHLIDWLILDHGTQLGSIPCAGARRGNTRTNFMLGRCDIPGDFSS